METQFLVKFFDPAEDNSTNPVEMKIMSTIEVLELMELIVRLNQSNAAPSLEGSRYPTHHFSVYEIGKCVVDLS